MKIVLFSDIHANLPGLEAFFEDIDKREYDAIYCLGDLVSYNIWPNEVIDEIRKRRIPTIAGNHDFYISRKSKDSSPVLNADGQMTNGAISAAFTVDALSDKNRTYLRTLPAHIKVEFQLNDDRLNLLLVHGSPIDISEYLLEDKDEQSMIRMMEDADADILCFGHTHKPYHRILNSGDEENPYFRHAVNLGSVGKPKDNDTRGSYVILEIDENASITSKNSVSVEIVKFIYDIEKAAKAVENSILPNSFAENLRNGY
ncbi:putative phosphoesterase [Owenweeksia hongkongensis DSM 17368]|uniref:Putative phosphoesterase n=1 Tax=Owenweeksia hongkongensis (strain DSM 17368 / CIP 108786 / JCM 12287 / NRRL B-23963 / UST20020801) TaxID=926562 RepID=G8R7S4_OWEHD|nr:metallophosphoesterase family protein [Owenweeksia hongkongensis]AEV33455.1 putative phosphoesterase [Owenweeksia hongkongensis DSM 17368]